MKRVFSFTLTIALLFSVLWVLSLPASAETELPADIPEDAKYDAIQAMDQFGCIPVAGGEINAGDLEDGRSYFFWEDVVLHLDNDIHCPTLYVYGSLQIDGKKQLTAEIIFASGSLQVNSGSILCPEMDNPPDPELIVHNGMTGIGGVIINDGMIRCPIISSGPESVTISGGDVKAEAINALFGYSQDGGTVDAASIKAREGLSVSGGVLDLGNANAEFIWFDGGIITITGTLSYDSEPPHLVSITFPMYIASPENGIYRDGQFYDKDGNPARSVRLEAHPVSHPFRDVEWNAFYYQPMVWAYEHDPRITTGVDDESFAPNDTCTRGQIVTFLWRAKGCPEPKRRETGFIDLKAGAFYQKAVAWAVENNITSGMDKTHFAPDASCTRGQVVTFLWRANGCPEPKSSSNPFTDVQKGKFYYKAVLWAVENGITNGMTKTSFAPDTTCTRGQIVTFLYRAMAEK